MALFFILSGVVYLEVILWRIAALGISQLFFWVNQDLFLAIKS